MKAVRLDLTCQRHRTFRFRIGLPPGTPALDETWGARMQLRSAPGATDGPFLDIQTTLLTAAGSYLYVDDGQLWGFLALADIQAIPANTDAEKAAVYRHDVALQSPTGELANAAAGTFTVEPVVTVTGPGAATGGGGGSSNPGALDFSTPLNSALIGAL